MTRVPLGPNTDRLFTEPGDLKAAQRLYDHFAGQVLDAEKNEPKIMMNLRTICIPQWGGKSNPTETLSVGWTFRAFLMGLPGGILGSQRLYDALQDVQQASLTVPIQNIPRVQLITFAIIALTTDVQRDLICAIFGLVTYLVEKSKELVLPEEPPQPGTELRRVASLFSLEKLARVFGPMLLGGHQQERGRAEETDQDQARREMEMFLIAQLLIESWQDVNRQLREWAAGVKQE